MKMSLYCGFLSDSCQVMVFPSSMDKHLYRLTKLSFERLLTLVGREEIFGDHSVLGSASGKIQVSIVLVLNIVRISINTDI